MTIQNIVCKLIGKKGKQAEIEIEGQRITIPSEYLPASFDEKEELQLCFLGAKEAKLKKENLAKEILEEILNGN